MSPAPPDSLADVPGEFVDNWTVRAIVATARSNKMLERMAHGMQCPFSLPKVGNPGVRQSLDVRAGAFPIAPKRQQFANLVDRKAKVAGPRDKSQSMN